MFLDSTSMEPCIAAYLDTGLAEWRNETDPEGLEVYAETAADISAAIRAVSDPGDEAGDRFAIAEGLYTYASRYHAGQACPLYRVLGVLENAPIHFRPNCRRDMADDARAVFELLRAIRRGDGGRAAADAAERAAVVLAVLCSASGRVEGEAGR